mgnify:CR=1 FL=1
MKLMVDPSKKWSGPYRKYDIIKEGVIAVVIVAFLAGLLVNTVDMALDAVSGFQPKMVTDPEDMDREIYECYCEIDLKGFEHKEKGEETGLALPYRVTLDRDSRQVLEIRRWWDEDDET